MAKKTVLAKKKRGPPATGKGTQVVVRMQPSPLAALDHWVTQQSDQPTRAEAIRRLVEIGLRLRQKKPKIDQRVLDRAADSIDRGTAELLKIGMKTRR
ncbi:hypothetical protein IVB41_10475 [Bradyrhizobium sp. 44]|uniref:hypothetical protein n=1 Tax=Bradyrhizobium sp. 44 TaxID=2782675 RepID=UPI001FFB1E92|nr:hypothetical protein [Bradyrhizobium sp. 44]MCK1284343.1 hypothetical protein [Bradyrhizobium sp. 44]